MTLSRSIVILLVSLLIGTGLIVGGVGFISAKTSVTELRGVLLSQVNDRVQQRLQAYFDQAEPALDFIEEAVFDDLNSIENWEEKSRLLSDFLKSEEDIIWLYFAEEEAGNMLGINIDPAGRYVVSRIDSMKDLVSEGFEIQSDDSIAPIDLLPHNPGRYDARERPWYQKAAAASQNGETVWTSPYQFLNSDVMGITATRALRNQDGDLIGVFGADLELGRVGAFLDSFTVADGGGALLLLESGVSVVPDESRNNPNIVTLHEALEQSDFNLRDLSKGQSLQINLRSADGAEYLGMFRELELPGEIRYFSGIMVPENAYLEKVRSSAILTAVTGFVILAIAIALGIWQSRRVTQPLSLLGEELREIGNLRFRDSGFEVQSKIREISLISEAVGKMKISLHAFSRYVPRDLVRLLLARGEEARPGGILQNVTAVFSDLAGFTQLSETLSPDEAFRELSKFLEIVATAQEARGGITSSFTGDGTLALFNAPNQQKNHGAEACLSALEILDKIKALNRERREEGKFEFKARFGINTAEVLLGNLGTRDRFAYTAIGDGVNLASRLEGLGKLYGVEILVGSDCVNEIGEVIEWRKVDRIKVVGRRSATEVLQPLGKAGQVDRKTLSARDFYEEALAVYFAGDFKMAREKFTKAQSAFPGGFDGPSALMIARIESFLKRPNSVPYPWEGIIAAEQK